MKIRNSSMNNPGLTVRVSTSQFNYWPSRCNYSAGKGDRTNGWSPWRSIFSVELPFPGRSVNAEDHKMDALVTSGRIRIYRDFHHSHSLKSPPLIFPLWFPMEERQFIRHVREDGTVLKPGRILVVMSHVFWNRIIAGNQMPKLRIDPGIHQVQLNYP